MVERLQQDPAWKDDLVFIADLIRDRPGNGVHTVGQTSGVLADRKAKK